MLSLEGPQKNKLFRTHAEQNKIALCGHDIDSITLHFLSMYRDLCASDSLDSAIDWMQNYTFNTEVVVHQCGCASAFLEYDCDWMQLYNLHI